MRFLERFWRTWPGLWARPSAESATLTSPPDSAEPLTRYLLSTSQFRRASWTVKASAFVPGPDGRKSVFRILGLTEPSIWKLGEAEVLNPPFRLHARADVTVRSVRDTGITLDADPPPSRHADLVGWPPDESACLLVAAQLADAAELRLNPAVHP